MSLDPHRVRLSAHLLQVVTAVGRNSSAAHRALLLLGAQAAGYDLSACRADIGRLLGEELDEPVMHQLATLYEAWRLGTDLRRDRPPPTTHAARHPPGADDVPMSVAADDPLAGVGIEV